MQEFYDQRTLLSDHWFPFREPVPATVQADACSVGIVWTYVHLVVPVWSYVTEWQNGQ